MAVRSSVDILLTDPRRVHAYRYLPRHLMSKPASTLRIHSLSIFSPPRQLIEHGFSRDRIDNDVMPVKLQSKSKSYGRVTMIQHQVNVSTSTRVTTLQSSCFHHPHCHWGAMTFPCGCRDRRFHVPEANNPCYLPTQYRAFWLLGFSRCADIAP